MGTRMSLVVLGIPGYLVLGIMDIMGTRTSLGVLGIPGYLVFGNSGYHGYQGVPSCPWYPIEG